jgi:integrase
MSIRWDPRNKRWRFEFDRVLAQRRHRLSRLLPRGWSQAQADAYDRRETARLAALAAGIERRDPLIDEAVVLYLRDKSTLKSHRDATQHLAAIAWAYAGRPMSALADVARDVIDQAETAPATVRNRLALLKAAARWAWRKHGLVEADPTVRMVLPQVNNERHVYITRRDMLRACRACDHWQAQIAIRVSFYSGLRLGELYAVEAGQGVLLLADTKNGDRRAVPVHPRIAHLLRHLPLTAPMISVQRAWQRARARVGLEHVHLHDLRHSAASEMVNAGVSLFTVGQVLGHRDQRSTQRYSHLTADTLAAAVGTIGRRKA